MYKIHYYWKPNAHWTKTLDVIFKSETEVAEWAKPYVDAGQITEYIIVPEGNEC